MSKSFVVCLWSGRTRRILRPPQTHRNIYIHIYIYMCVCVLALHTTSLILTKHYANGWGAASCATEMRLTLLVNCKKGIRRFTFFIEQTRSAQVDLQLCAWVVAVCLYIYIYICTNVCEYSCVCWLCDVVLKSKHCVWLSPPRSNNNLLCFAPSPLLHSSDAEITMHFASVQWALAWLT